MKNEDAIKFITDVQFFSPFWNNGYPKHFEALEIGKLALKNEPTYEDALKWLSEGKLVRKQHKKFKKCFDILVKQKSCDYISYRHPFFTCELGESVRNMHWCKINMESLFDFEREYEYSIVNEEDLSELDDELTSNNGFAI